MLNIFEYLPNSSDLYFDCADIRYFILYTNLCS